MRKNTHTHTRTHARGKRINVMSNNFFCKTATIFWLSFVFGKSTGIKLGYAVTSVLKCCWHLEQGESIRITQRVHYEWIMHYGTSLDMQQSECQNSFEHTFFSPCSHISRLNKDTRNPVSCSFRHYDKHRNSTRGERCQCQKCRYRW